MRRSQIGFALTLGLFALTCLLPRCLEAQPSTSADPFVAVVLKVVPPVLMQRAGTNQQIPLQQDNRLYPGDRLAAGEGGQASIVFADNAVEIKLHSNSELIFQGQRSSSGLVKRLFLQIGNLLTEVLRGDMEVVTPTCVASVKGTQWWTTVDLSAQTAVIVLEGQVQVRNPVSGTVAQVSAGNTATSTLTGSLEVAPSDESQIPGGAQLEKSSLDIEYQDGSGETKTLHIEFEE